MKTHIQIPYKESKSEGRRSVQVESAKLRAYVLTWQRALRTYVPTCERALHAYLLTCQRVLRA